MEEKFYSKENFIVLKEIINKISSKNIETVEENNDLFNKMVHTYENFNDFSGNLEHDFHSLNKTIINMYSDVLKQIPQKPLQSLNNIFNPSENVVDNQNTETIENEDNVNNLFTDFKKTRNLDLNDNSMNNSDNIEELISNGGNLNEHMSFPHHNDDINNLNNEINENFPNFNSNNFLDNINQNQLETNETTLNRNKINFETDNFDNFNQNRDDNERNIENNNVSNRHNIIDTLNPYSMYKHIRKQKQIEKEIIITIDSKDRDLSLYPNSTHFQVKFGAISDTIEIPTRLGENGVIIHEPATLYKGYQGAVINTSLKNIKSIEIINATIPYVSYFYNGSFPVEFNSNNQTDGNMTVSESWNSVSGNLGYLSNAYRPLFSKSTITDPAVIKTGIPRDVLDEPYILLNIDELDNQHTSFSTNIENSRSFARLINEKLLASQLSSSFAIFTTYSENEGMLFDPTLLSSLDKMTLKLKDQDNNYLNLGQDKTYVKIIETSDKLIINKNKALTSENGTKITIVDTHDDYLYNKSTNKKIEGHCLKPGDIVYFYTTKPCNNEHIYRLNSEQVNITITSNKIKINLKQPSVQSDGKVVTNRDIRLSQYLFIGDYISLDDTLFRVIGFDGKQAILDSNPDSSLYTTNNVGFVRQNKRGFTSNDPLSLFYKGGHVVCYIDEDDTPNPYNFTINLGYNVCNDYTNSDDNSIFFIKKHLQTSFMFKFTVVEKDYEEIKSDIL